MDLTLRKDLHGSETFYKKYKRHGETLGSLRERKELEIYSGYVALMIHISNSETYTYEEATKKQV